MPDIRTCMNGHQWGADESPSPVLNRPSACPTCGAAGETMAPSGLPAPAEIDAEMPPSPRPLPDGVVRVAASLLAGPTQAGPQGLPAVAGYEILGRLGRGGMGVVYKARQRGSGRLVALKMIRGGAHADARDLARFRTEAEAVARLRHPHIVLLYEAGEADGGAYFVLEYVAGGSLAQQLSGRPQPAEAAARLVEPLARAMAYAHEQGVVHRDLKPANVLLEGMSHRCTQMDTDKKPEQRSVWAWSPDQAQPVDSSICVHRCSSVAKITDFGLAKRLDAAPGSSLSSGRTQTGEILGTPSYMAPEQTWGRPGDVGPAADVYGVGAILYECLTGRPPFQGATPVDTLLQVRTEEAVSPRRLVPSVPWALDAVCRKCLHKEPRRRYPSAIALAEDLARFLAGRPVQARPAGAWERVLRWARRRKAGAALMAVSGLALVSLLTLGIWHYAQLKGYNAELRLERHTADTSRQVAEAKEAEASRQKEEAENQWRRAEANFQSALAAVDQMLTRTSEDDQFLVHEPRMELLRQKLLEDALRFYEDFLRERADDPVVRWEAASSYLRVGDIRKRLGRQAAAEEAYGAAIPLLEALAAEFPGRPEYRYKLAGCYINLGGSLLLNTARLEEAERAFRRALDIQQPLTDEFPDRVEYRSTLSGIQINLGTVMIHTGRLGEAETILRQALDQRRRLADEHPENPRFRRDLARVHSNLGIVLGGTGRAQEAGEVYRQALDLQRALVEQFPRVAVYRQELAGSHNTLAGVLGRTGREAEAETEYGQALALQQRLVEEFPRVPAYRQEFAGSRYNLARSLDRRKRSTEAEEAYRQALELYERLVEEFPEVPTYQNQMGNNLTHLARLLGEQGRLTESCEKAERGWRCQLAALRLLPKDTRVQKAVAESCAVLAETRVRLNDHRGAAAVATEVPRYSPREGSAYRYAAGFLARCAGLAEEDQTLPAARRQDLAKSYRDQAVALLRQGAGFPNFGADSLTTDPHFASLRSRADFQEVLGAARR